MHFDSVFRGSLTDHPRAELMKAEIGGLIINAGGIELMIDLMIVAVSLTPPDVAELRKHTYAQRVKRLQQLAADRQIPKALQKRLANAIDRAKEVMEMRNKMAHGCLGLVFRGEADQGQLIGIGVLDLKGTKGRIAPAYTLEQIGAAQNAAQKACVALEAIYQDIKASIAAVSALPASGEVQAPQ